MMRKLFFLIFLLSMITVAGLAWLTLAAPNTARHKNVVIKIRRGADYNSVLQQLTDKEALHNAFTFEIVSRWKRYPERIKSGSYLITPGMNNRQIVNMLAAGLQSPVKLVIYNIRTKEDFAGLISRTVEIDSSVITEILSSEAFCGQYNLDTSKILSRFIVDNYELYWNVTPENFFKKMNDAYDRFWNDTRKQKAIKLGMSPWQVTTLASIVEKEVIFDKEMPTVAGVYLNRIRIGMPLQADPTLVFALRDFNARRVTNYHKEFDSPYNTYKYAGLPPGPICMPRKKAIDAVLNAETHNYLYFCANPDMSGYSIFSATYQDQMRTAAQYRKKLDAMNIR